MTNSEQYERYKAKFRLANKEMPMLIEQDDNCNYWIVQLDNIEHSKVAQSNVCELVIPKFIHGFKPIDQILEVTDSLYRKYKLLDKSFSNLYKRMLSNREKDIHDATQEALFTQHAVKRQMIHQVNIVRVSGLDAVIVDGNNIPLHGQLSGMFTHIGAKELIFKNFNACGITDISGAFSYSQFERIDFSGFNQQCIQNIDSAFLNCDKLEKIDLSMLKINKLESMTDVFAQCRKLEEIKLPRIELHRMAMLKNTFIDCVNLEEVNTEQLIAPNRQGKASIELRLTFTNCKKLKKINLSNIEYTDIGRLEHPFLDCKKLEIVEFKPTLNKLVKKQEFRRLLTEKGIQNTAKFLGDTVEFRV